jgi:hypothetical protein
VSDDNGLRKALGYSAASNAPGFHRGDGQVNGFGGRDRRRACFDERYALLMRFTSLMTTTMWEFISSARRDCPSDEGVE